LAQFLDKVESFRENLGKLVTRGYPEDALRIALKLGLTDKKALSDKTRLAQLAEIIEASGFHKVEVGDDEEHGTSYVKFLSRRDGVEREVRLDWNLLTSAEFRALANNSQGLEAAQSTSFTLRKGEDLSTHDTLDETLDRMYAGAKKGLS